HLTKRYGRPVSAEDLMAYIAAVAAHPAYTARFAPELVQPGLRIPLTADPETFAVAAELGQSVVWLHTYGERFTDPAKGRPLGPPRLPKDRAPRIPRDGMIPTTHESMPDTIDYNVP